LSQIEQLKIKLAGNEQFHTRVAFQFLDLYKKNQVNQDTLVSALRNASVNGLDTNCLLFLRRYSKNGALTYDE
jgi:hypothetical protein